MLDEVVVNSSRAPGAHHLAEPRKDRKATAVLGERLQRQGRRGCPDHGSVVIRHGDSDRVRTTAGVTMETAVTRLLVSS